MLKPICKRCLLSEIDIKGEYKNVFEYIALIPEDRKAEKSEYEHRLAICKSCNELTNGMCAKCGCFVEVRAAKKEMYCAGEVKLW